MKRLKCEMCGSTDLVKQDGMFVCQVCGTKYSVEEAKKMMIEGTVEIAGTVKVDTSTAIVRARQSLAHGEMQEAKKHFDRALEADPVNAEAWWGKFLIDFQVKDEKDLFAKPTLDLFRRIECNLNYQEALHYAKEPFLTRVTRFQAQLADSHETATKNEERECFQIVNGCLKKITTIAARRYKDTNLVIPEGVTSIDWAAFGASCFSTVTFPQSLIECDCDFATYDDIKRIKTVRITDLIAWCKIKFSACGRNPLCCAERFMLNNEEIIDLKIPEEVKTIKDWAFNGFEKCKSVFITYGVTEIGNGAFDGCKGLTSIKIPDSVTKIGDHAFDGCKGLTSIKIPDSVTKIGDHAFARCYALTSLTIPSSIIDFGTAFCECYGLTSIIIPGNVKTIKKKAFAYCGNLTEVTICDGVKTIEDETFYRCKSLRSISIPQSVSSIGAAFGECPNIEEVTIPKKFAGFFNSGLKRIFENASKIKFRFI